jgi:hypothetical protein
MNNTTTPRSEFCTCTCGCTVRLRTVAEIKSQRCKWCWQGDIDADLPPTVDDLDAPDPLAQALRLAA